MAVLDRIRKPRQPREHVFSMSAPQERMTVRKRVGEMISESSLGVRSAIKGFRNSFWPGQISYERGQVSYARTRALYSNASTTTSLAGFSRRIINATVDYIGLPTSETGDPGVDEWLNKGIHDCWGGKLTEMVRDACRDSKTVIRYRRADPDNPLVSDEEWSYGYLEVIPPEMVEIYYSPTDKTWIERAYVTHYVDQIDEDVSDFTNTRTLTLPSTVTHQIIEEITPESFKYWDATRGEWLTELEQDNDWGFVPLHEVFNEWDETMSDGQSDLENPEPFIHAFHDVLAQSLTAHKHHSTPKAKFKIHDMMTFLLNNFQDSFETDGNGEPIPNTFSGEVSWKGTEIFFIEPDEDVGFLEAKSVLGDSKTLLDFLLECISIASETPKTILLNAGKTDADELGPFSKKIERKRAFFLHSFQVVCKMALAVNAFDPIKPKLSWDGVDPNVELLKSQALQQDTMSLEVARAGQVISDDTMRESLRKHLPAMKPGPAEKAAAKNNVMLPVVNTNSLTGSDSGGQGE